MRSVHIFFQFVGPIGGREHQMAVLGWDPSFSIGLPACQLPESLCLLILPLFQLGLIHSIFQPSCIRPRSATSILFYFHFLVIYNGFCSAANNVYLFLHFFLPSWSSAALLYILSIFSVSTMFQAAENGYSWKSRLFEIRNEC